MSEQTQIVQQRNKAINAAANPFDRKYVEKMLFAQFMPAAVSAPVIKCKKTPRKKCNYVAERREKR